MPNNQEIIEQKTVAEIFSCESLESISWMTAFPHALEDIGWSIPQRFMQSRVIKHSLARTVFELFPKSQSNIEDDPGYIVKVFRMNTFWDRIHQWILPRHIQEWRNLLDLHKAGLAVPAPIAVGSGPKAGYLILRKIPGVRSLKEIYHNQIIEWEKRRHWAKDLAKLVAQLHNLHYIHQDLHTGNVLENEQGQLYLVDLYNVHHCRWAHRRQCLENLAMLADSFTELANTSDYLCFFQEYLQHSTLFQSQNWRTLWPEMCQIFWKYRYGYWNKRAMRCLKNNKYFQQYSHNDIVGIGYRDQADLNHHCLQFSELLQDPKRIMKNSSLRIMKNSRSSLVFATSIGIVKQYRRKKARNWIFDWFRPSRARRAWLKGYHCITRGIPTAKPLFYAEKRWLWLPVFSYLVTQEIPNAQNLVQFLQSAATPDIKTMILRQVGHLVYRMHQAGLRHRDLKASNLLFDGQGRLYLIDLDGMEVTNSMHHKIAKKDLSRLLQSVAQISGITPADLQTLWNASLTNT